jgi:hypothetical protein
LHGFVGEKMDRAESAAPSGVVHQNVEPVESLRGGIDQRIAFFAHADVSSDEMSGVSCSHLGDRLPSLVLRPPVDHHSRTCCKKPFGDASTDAPRPASN